MAMAIRILPDLQRLWEATASHIVEAARRSVDERGSFRLALSGGETPKPVYRILARPDWQSRLPWSRVDVFWVDERNVPQGSPQSNFRLAEEALLGELTPGPRTVHRVGTEGPHVTEIAESYENEIRSTFGAFGDNAPPPRFDLVWLGMGSDGHTASLFPGASALDEARRWVVATRSPSPPHDRISMTLPLLNQAREVVFLAAGAEKARALSRVFGVDSTAERPPAARVAPVRGSLLWFVDEQAASLLPRDALSSVPSPNPGKQQP